MSSRSRWNLLVTTDHTTMNARTGGADLNVCLLMFMQFCIFYVLCVNELLSKQVRVCARVFESACMCEQMCISKQCLEL